MYSASKVSGQPTKSEIFRARLWSRRTARDALGPLQILHLNFECGAKCLSCVHISRALTGQPHSEPHMSSMQRRALWPVVHSRRSGMNVACPVALARLSLRFRGARSLEPAAHHIRRAATSRRLAHGSRAVTRSSSQASGARLAKRSSKGHVLRHATR